MPDLWVGFPDYYGLLRVAPDASDVEVRSAWRAAAKRWHPDMNGGQDAAAMMRKVNEAWQVLGDRDARAVYDEVYFAWRTGSEQLSVELSNRLDMQRERRQARAKAAEWVRWGREDRGRWANDNETGGSGGERSGGTDGRGGNGPEARRDGRESQARTQTATDHANRTTETSEEEVPKAVLFGVLAAILFLFVVAAGFAIAFAT